MRSVQLEPDRAVARPHAQRLASAADPTAKRPARFLVRVALLDAEVVGDPAVAGVRIKLGTPVEINRKGKGGTIAIAFTNETELQRLYEYLTERK